MELESLNPQQLSIVKEQLEEEVEGLASSANNLRHAKAKYRASKSALEAVNEREILVPLTASVYVPGRLVNANSFLVEIGTGYYVEKNKDQASEFCTRKVNMLTENIEKISKLINDRKRGLEIAMKILQKKMQEARAAGNNA